MDNLEPVIVNFSCVDDQALIWNTLKDGTKTSVTVTKDSRTHKEKQNFINNRKTIVKVEKKSDYHAHCVPEEHKKHCKNEDENENLPDNDEFKKGDRALIFHGVESDWVEEEMMDDDVEFIRDVIETKVHKILKSVGIQKRVSSICLLIKHLVTRFI